MKNKILYIIWACLFILCGLLGFIPQPGTGVSWLLMLLAALFFVPGWLLLYRGAAGGNLGTVRVVRNLSLLSLGTTLLLLVLNFLSGRAGEAAGQFLYGVLVFFSAPMVCGQYWVFSLFLWAYLLMTSFSVLKKAKKKVS